MKKITNNIISKCLLLMAFIMTNVHAWASDAGNSTTTGGLNEAITKPSFWIGVVAFIACIVGFFMIDRPKKEDRELQ
ncbi:MAG: hypothetical protein QM791_21745 [Ferruginibacter sp.]